MALLFSEVTLEAEDRQRKFLVSGIPTDLDDLDGWTAYEDFLLELHYPQLKGKSKKHKKEIKSRTKYHLTK